MPQNDCGNHLHSINPSKTGVDSGVEAPTSSLQLLTEMHHVNNNNNNDRLTAFDPGQPG